MYKEWKKISLLVCMSITCFCLHCDSFTKSFRPEFEESNLQQLDSQDSANSVHLANSTTHVFREFAAGLSSRTDLVKRERVAHDHIHEVMFAVQQQNVAKLTRLLHQISDPDDKNYGNHRSRIEIEEATSNPESRNFLLQFLQDAGATTTSESIFGEFISAQAPVSLWEKMFNTQFFKFHHISDESEDVVGLVRAEMYSVPTALHEHVASVFQTIQMPQKKWGRPVIYSRSRNSSSIIQSHVKFGTIDPHKLNYYYGIENNIGSFSSSQSAIQSLNQFVSPNDLALFQNAYRLPRQNVTKYLGGGSDDFICTIIPQTCSEGNLDMQYLMSISQGTPTMNLYTDLNNFSGWLLAVANLVNPPLVVSISYGASEASITASEFDAFNLQAIKLGLMGVTILVSSGDDGVQSYEERYKDICGYYTLFPASSPYVTAVGATQGPESLRSERTCQSDYGGIITSGGGFSIYYPRPSWQSADVIGYFDKVAGTSSAPAPGYSTTGRGYPDLALAGTAYKFVIGGRWFFASGTSASTPVLAAMVSLVNAARLDANMSSLGWLNPTLYKRSKSFVIDTLIGQNNCGTGIKLPCCLEGFNATAGWDPTTGLGSVNFPLFKNEMMKVKIFDRSSFMPSASPTVVGVPTLLTSRLPTMAVTPKDTPTRTSTPPISTTTGRPSKLTAPTTTGRPSKLTAPTTTGRPSKLTASPTAFNTRTPTSRRGMTPTAKPSIRRSSRPTLSPIRIPTTKTLTPTIKPSTYKPSLRVKQAAYY